MRTVKGKRHPPAAELSDTSAGAARQDIYHIKRQAELGSVNLGRREQNKFDKLRRIAAAAREQFATKGYDGTTLRDIAQEADVALGTVGFYAETKQDLVLLIFNEVMEKLVIAAAESVPYEKSLVQSLVAFFRPFYTTFAAEAALYRILLRENVFNGTSQHALEFQRHRGMLVAGLGALIDEARAAGEVSARLDVELAARTVFFVLFAAVRWWIAANDPAVEPGLKELGRMLGLVVSGMKGSEVVRPAR